MELKYRFCTFFPEPGKIVNTDNPEPEGITMPGPHETVSICDLLKENTTNLIKKIESQIPVYGQLYSDMYKEGLHVIDDAFGACYISEREFFDRLGLDQRTLRQWDTYSKSVVDFYSRQIDASTDLLKAWASYRISVMEMYEKYIHLWMDSYRGCRPGPARPVDAGSRAHPAPAT